MNFNENLWNGKKKTVENSIECTLLVIKLLFLHFVQFILATSKPEWRWNETLAKLLLFHYFASLQLIYVEHQLLCIQWGVIREMF